MTNGSKAKAKQLLNWSQKVRLSVLARDGSAGLQVMEMKAGNMLWMGIGSRLKRKMSTFP